MALEKDMECLVRLTAEEYECLLTVEPINWPLKSPKGSILLVSVGWDCFLILQCLLIVLCVGYNVYWPNSGLLWFQVQGQEQ